MDNAPGKFEVIPAIDMMNGRCVRLRRGVFADRSEYPDSPLEVATAFESAGFSRLHLVDLDGARDGVNAQFSLVRDICAATKCRVDVGGGIRTLEQVKRYLDAGAEMVTVSTMAVRHEKRFTEGLGRFGPDRFILAADVKNGRVAVSGWKEESETDLFSFLEKMVAMGVRRVLCTDTDRDGMMCGPALGLYREILHRFPRIHLLASGGVHHLDQVADLRRAGLSGVVVGRALYEGALWLDQLAVFNESGGKDAGETNYPMS